MKSKSSEWMTDDGLKRLEAWARDGLTDEQIAHNVGVSVRTLSAWKSKHLPILHALKRGKQVVDIEVENALLKRALGYKYDEVTKELRLDRSTGKYRMVITKTVTKEVLPDTTAQIFWLKNRKPDVWRDKRETLGGEDNGVVICNDI